jgi:hypothetical protein
MIVREIVTSCSNPHVARAAVASIGGDFERRVAREAAQGGFSTAAFASHIVRDFARSADEAEWDALEDAICGAELPILAGLRFIIERGLKMRFDAIGPRVPGLLADAARSQRSAALRGASHG